MGSAAIAKWGFQASFVRGKDGSFKERAHVGRVLGRIAVALGKFGQNLFVGRLKDIVDVERYALLKFGLHRPVALRSSIHAASSRYAHIATTP